MKYRIIMALLFVKTPYHHRAIIKKKPCITWKNKFSPYCGTVLTAWQPRETCISESNSWCKHQQNGGSEDYKSTVNLPKVIKELLVPIFLDLWDDNLLSGCLEGTTQNINETFNWIIWKKCAKNIFISRHVLGRGQF